MGWVFRAMGKIAAPFVRWNEILPGALWSAVEANWPGALVLGTVNETMTVLVLLVGARERGRRGVCGSAALGGGFSDRRAKRDALVCVCELCDQALAVDSCRVGGAGDLPEGDGRDAWQRGGAGARRPGGGLSVVDGGTAPGGLVRFVAGGAPGCLYEHGGHASKLGGPVIWSMTSMRALSALRREGGNLSPRARSGWC